MVPYIALYHYDLSYPVCINIGGAKYALINRKYMMPNFILPAGTNVLQEPLSPPLLLTALPNGYLFCT